jgi:hypothetical protein
MNNFLTILMCIAIAGACSYYAKKQGRNPYVWFLIGLIFGIFGLFLLFLIPMVKYYLQKRLLKRKQAAPQPSSQEKTITIDSAISTMDIHTEGHYLEKLWYYLDKENNQFGPMSYTAFKQAWKEGKIHSSTYVWNDALSTWKRFDELFSLQRVQIQ